MSRSGGRSDGGVLVREQNTPPVGALGESLFRSQASADLAALTSGTLYVVGIAFGCFAGGAALGAVIAGRTHWPFGPALAISYLLDGVGWLPLPWTHSLPLAIAGITFSSVTSGYNITTIISWRMRVIPEELIGRVFGVVRLIVLIGIFPASILGGWLADHLGVRPVMAISAFGYFALALLLLGSRAVRVERR